jgi:hypothetical protein
MFQSATVKGIKKHMKTKQQTSVLSILSWQKIKHAK